MPNRRKNEYGMHPLRRDSDQRAILRIWEKFNPIPQIFGYVVLIVTVIFSAGGIWSNVNAYGGRLDALEIWRQQESQDISAMRESIKDIHDYLMPKK